MNKPENESENPTLEPSAEEAKKSSQEVSDGHPQATSTSPLPSPAQEHSHIDIAEQSLGLAPAKRSATAQTAIALGGVLFLVVAAVSFLSAIYMLSGQVGKSLENPTPASSPSSTASPTPTSMTFGNRQNAVFQSIAATESPGEAPAEKEKKAEKEKRKEHKEFWDRYSAYFAPLLAFAIGLVSAFLGYSLLRAAGSAPREVIPPQDYELLSEMLRSGNLDGINNYVKLGSLTGTIGTFIKLQITGLPLATIGLTIFFALLGVLNGGQNPFYDLAKLTLGAFIGSYVQRQGTDAPRVPAPITPVIPRPGPPPHP